MRYGFGVDIGGTTVKIAWFEESGKKLRAWEIPTVRENNGQQILPDIAAALQFSGRAGCGPRRCDWHRRGRARSGG